MKHGFKFKDNEYDIGLSRSADGYRLHHAGQVWPFTLQASEEGGWILASNASGRRVIDHLAVAVDGDEVHIHLDGDTHTLRFEHALERLAQLNEAGAADAIRATMPGSLISLSVAPGDAVKKGQTLLIMESMKMETTIVAPRDGVIAEVLLASGQTFDKDAVLLSLEPLDADQEQPS